MNKVKNILVAAALMAQAIVALPVLVPTTVSAAPGDNKAQVCEGISAIGGGNSCNSDAAKNELSGFIKQIINILLFIIGAAAVIMIIIGAFRYVLSNGDASATKGAKDTILYAVVGVIVAAMAYAIVNFVIGSL